MISERGIEADLEKIKAIMDMRPPRSIKEVQKLAGEVGSSESFYLAICGQRPTFKVLRGMGRFEWNKTSQDAFEEVLGLASVLTKPKTGETLYLST
ncbi:UNVERIFIED_CONTAM: hypothetical protein Slati_4597900 [Sesamum latifolium]|uniref:Uncharacterized protein n=1 Tax=Sesamum latifolium TaxID=2727402 RepID=A0AAW2S345_9LAMI